MQVLEVNLKNLWNCGRPRPLREERGQSLEDVVDRVNQLHSDVACAHPATTAEPPDRTTWAAVHSVQETQEPYREAMLCHHLPNVGKLDVVKRLGEVDDRRGGRKKHGCGECRQQLNQFLLCTGAVDYTSKHNLRSDTNPRLAVIAEL